jgi:hypothetical protein
MMIMFFILKILMIMFLIIMTYISVNGRWKINNETFQFMKLILTGKLKYSKLMVMIL